MSYITKSSASNFLRIRGAIKNINQPRKARYSVLHRNRGLVFTICFMAIIIIFSLPFPPDVSQGREIKGRYDSASMNLHNAGSDDLLRSTLYQSNFSAAPWTMPSPPSGVRTFEVAESTLASDTASYQPYPTTNYGSDQKTYTHNNPNYVGYTYIALPSQEYLTDNTTTRLRLCAEFFMIPCGGQFCLPDYAAINFFGTQAFNEMNLTWNNQPEPGTLLRTATHVGRETYNTFTLDGYSPFIEIQRVDDGNDWPYLMYTKESAYKPYASFTHSKAYSGVAGAYIQTDTTEALALDSPTFSPLVLRPGDRITARCTTNSTHQITLHLLNAGSPQKVLEILPEGNQNLGSRVYEVSLDEFYIVDQFEFTGMFDNSQYFRLNNMTIDRSVISTPSVPVDITPQTGTALCSSPDLVVRVTDDHINRTGAHCVVPGLPRLEFNLGFRSVVINSAIVGSCSLGGQALDVAIYDQFTFLAAGTSGIQAFNANDPNHPTLVWALSPWGTTTKFVDTWSSFLSVLAYDGISTSCLITYALTNPQNPSELSRLTLAGIPQELEITMEGSSTIAVIATQQGFYTVNLTVPDSPIILCEEALGGISNLAVLNSIVYRASGSAGLQVIDITNASAPVIVGNYAQPDFTATRVAATGTHAYVWYWNDTSNTAGMTIFDVSIPSNPVPQGTYFPGNTNCTDLTALNLFAYTIMDSQLLVFDVANFTAPKLSGACTLPGSGGAIALNASGHVAFIANGGQGLQVLSLNATNIFTAVAGDWDEWCLDWGQMPSGTYSISVHLIDINGTQWDPTTVQVILDNDAPVVSAIQPDNGMTYGHSTTPTLRIMVYDDPLGVWPNRLDNSSVRCTIANKDFALALANESIFVHDFVLLPNCSDWNQWNATWRALASGYYRLNFTATDLVGNVGWNASFGIWLDAYAPAVIITNPLVGGFFGESVNFNITATDNETVVQAIYYKLASWETWVPLVVPQPYQASVTLVGSIDISGEQDGVFTLQVAAADCGANWGFESVTCTKDSIVPHISVTIPSSGVSIYEGSPNYSLDIVELNLASIWVSADNWVTIYPLNGVIGFLPSALWSSVPYGAILLQFMVEDKAGNENTIQVAVLKQDSTPNLTIVAPLGDSYSTPPTYTLDLLHTDALGTLWVSADGGATRFSLSGLSGTLPEAFWATLAPGPHVILFHAVSIYNRTSEDTVVVNVVEDPGSNPDPFGSMSWPLIAYGVAVYGGMMGVLVVVHKYRTRKLRR